MLLVCFLRVGFFFVKANGIWFLKGGREDWCDTTANMWRRHMSRKGAEVVGFCEVVWISFFPFEAGNPITDGSFVGFNNSPNEIWARGLLRLMRDKKQGRDFRRSFRGLNPAELSGILSSEHLWATESTCLQTLEQIMPPVTCSGQSWILELNSKSVTSFIFHPSLQPFAGSWDDT